MREQCSNLKGLKESGDINQRGIDNFSRFSGEQSQDLQMKNKTFKYCQNFQKYGMSEMEEDINNNLNDYQTNYDNVGF